MKTIRVRKSRNAFERACRLIRAESIVPRRAFGAVGGPAVVIARGEGPFLFIRPTTKKTRTIPLDYVGLVGALALVTPHRACVRAIGKKLSMAPAASSSVAPTDSKRNWPKTIVD